MQCIRCGLKSEKNVKSQNLPYVRLGAMTLLFDDLWCHPVGSSSHGAQYQRIGTGTGAGTGVVCCYIHTQFLGTTKVYQLDHAIWHQHYVAALYVAKTSTELIKLCLNGAQTCA